MPSHREQKRCKSDRSITGTSCAHPPRGVEERQSTDRDYDTAQILRRHAPEEPVRNADDMEPQQGEQIGVDPADRGIARFPTGYVAGGAWERDGMSARPAWG